MLDGFRQFQTDASQFLAQYRDQLLNTMFLKRKILMTFLSYQRAIDETIKQLSLVIVIAKRRLALIEFWDHVRPTSGTRTNPTSPVVIRKVRSSNNTASFEMKKASSEMASVVDQSNTSIVLD